MLVADIIHSQIDSIQAIDKKTLKVRRFVGKGIREFIKQYAKVPVLWSREGGYYHNADAVSGFTSIILKVR